MTGPPIEPLMLWYLKVPGLNLFGPACVPTKELSRVLKNIVPLKSFVPLLVTMLIPAPTKLPCRTSYGATLTCTWSSASSEIGATLVRSPGSPPNPNELLKYDPSTVILFKRLSCPANETNERAPDDVGCWVAV